MVKTFERALCWGLVPSLVALTACSSGPKRPEPAPLQEVTAQVPARQVWQAQVGELDPLVSPLVQGTAVWVANATGSVFQFNTDNGQQVWRLDLGMPLSAAVGSDGQTTAVVTQNNDVVAVVQGKEVWRTRVPARVFTAPLVAGQRVFVLAADRSVYAYDGQTGTKLWTQSAARGTDNLVLQQPGVLLAVNDNLVVGYGGRLVALNPNNGTLRWSATIANPRGTNEVERLVDIVGRTGRSGDTVCARSFQTAVGCVDTNSGKLLWTKPSDSAVGVHADADQVYGVDSKGTVQAWKLGNGEQAWSVNTLAYRGLSAPLAAGRSVVLGDAQGYVHLLSRTNGVVLNRFATDGSPVVYAPLLAGKTMLAFTRKGGVYAWRPE